MRPKVSINGAIGNYHVIGNENKYNVKLFRDERGQKIAECCCKANENGMFCYHIAAAVLAHRNNAPMASGVKKETQARKNKPRPLRASRQETRRADRLRIAPYLRF